MPDDGGRSEWERRMAAQRREAERQEKEKARLAREREKARKEAHLAAQQSTAEAKTAAVEQQDKDLDEVLASVLSQRPVSFASLMAPSAPPRFEPGALAAGNPRPDWTDFVPPESKGLARIFGGNARHAREVAEAQARFDTAVKAHAQAEVDRQRALTNARARQLPDPLVHPCLAHSGGSSEHSEILHFRRKAPVRQPPFAL